MGIIEAIGPKVQKPLKKGDRVAGFTHGANAVQAEDGCFAEYCVAKGDILMLVPPNLSDVEAATLGVGVTTVGQALYQSLGLPLPESGVIANYPLLIYGGSTATGTLAIQYAVLSGCPNIITTCSPRNFELVKSLGAHAVFYYADADCTEKIREYTRDSLTLALDCISSAESAKICSEAISTSAKDGVVSYLLTGTKHDRVDVQAKFTLGYTVVGEDCRFAGVELPAKPEDFEFGKQFWELSERLFAQGKVKVHPPEVRGGGLQGIFEGLNDMREGRVSGVKLVYFVEDA